MEQGLEGIIEKALSEWSEDHPGGERATIDDILSVCGTSVDEHLEKHLHKFRRQIVRRVCRSLSSGKVAIEHPETGELVLVKVRAILTIEERGEFKYVPVQCATQSEHEKHIDIINDNLLRCKLKALAENVRYEQKFFAFTG